MAGTTAKEFTGPSWNDISRLCATGGVIELKPKGPGNSLKLVATRTRNHFAPDQYFLVECRLEGTTCRIRGIAPNSVTPATYTMV